MSHTAEDRTTDDDLSMDRWTDRRPTAWGVVSGRARARAEVVPVATGEGRFVRLEPRSGVVSLYWVPDLRTPTRVRS